MPGDAAGAGVEDAIEGGVVGAAVDEVDFGIVLGLAGGGVDVVAAAVGRLDGWFGGRGRRAYK